MIFVVALILIPLFVLLFIKRVSLIPLLACVLFATMALSVFVGKPWFVILGMVSISSIFVRGARSSLRGDSSILFLILLLLFMLLYEGSDVMASLTLGMSVGLPIVYMKLKSIAIVMLVVLSFTLTYLLWHEKEV